MNLFLSTSMQLAMLSRRLFFSPKGALASFSLACSKSCTPDYVDNLSLANFNLKQNNSLQFITNVASHEYIKVEQVGYESKVGLITLNRPKSLNAICDRLLLELTNAANMMDEDPNIGAIVISGSEKTFAVGDDIKEMSKKTFLDVFGSNFLGNWDDIANVRKPVIAAVNGFALGGGCELAMIADIIIAGDTARFGLPEINLGTIPGVGGTQRLIRAVGKSRAMQMCLTGEMITAHQAESWGLVSSVHPPEKVLDAAIEIANKIVKKSKLTIAICKEAVNNAYEMTLNEGLRAEKRLFHATFATEDRSEGMKAFVEKRKPRFTDK